eukprot:scaffold152589_cov44-Prasinocladus_malaysianus.AAC.2
MLLNQPHGLWTYLQGPGALGRCNEAAPLPAPWPPQLRHDYLSARPQRFKNAFHPLSITNGISHLHTSSQHMGRGEYHIGSGAAGKCSEAGPLPGPRPLQPKSCSLSAQPQRLIACPIPFFVFK